MSNVPPLNILLQEGLLDWSTLLVGWNYKWATRNDVIRFAVDWLVAHRDAPHASIVSLAASDEAPEHDVRESLEQIARQLERFDIIDDTQYGPLMERWRYAHLLALQRTQLSEEEKIDRLQKIYAEFSYPSDMAGCSKYGLGPDPLAAMNAVVDGLRSVLFQSGGRVEGLRIRKADD